MWVRVNEGINVSQRHRTRTVGREGDPDWHWTVNDHDHRPGLGGKQQSTLGFIADFLFRLLLIHILSICHLSKELNKHNSFRC